MLSPIHSRAMCEMCLAKDDIFFASIACSEQMHVQMQATQPPADVRAWHVPGEGAGPVSWHLLAYVQMSRPYLHISACGAAEAADGRRRGWDSRRSCCWRGESSTKGETAADVWAEGDPSNGISVQHSLEVDVSACAMQRQLKEEGEAGTAQAAAAGTETRAPKERLLRTFGQKRAKADPVSEQAPALAPDVLALIAGKK